MPTYQGYEVLDSVEPHADDQFEEFDRRFEILDSGVGSRTSDWREDAPANLTSFTWMCFTRAELAAYRAFIDSKKARLVPFWVPSYSRDFGMIAFPAAAQVKIEEIGYSDQLFPATGARRHIWAWSPDRVTKHYKKITAAVNNGDGTETLTLDSTPSPAITTAWNAGFLRLVRLEEDVPEIEYIGGVSVIRLLLRELPLEAPL